jgi:5'-phosphate synthase pdxT subunit
MAAPTIGVLALQGDVREHVAALRDCGVDAIPVRLAEELERVHGLALPGGESTTMGRLLRVYGLVEPLRERLAGGMPTFSTCAGLILLATTVLDGRPDQLALGTLDVDVRRNGYGRQVDSFEADLRVAGLDDRPLHAVFIRAPLVERVGAGVETLATLEGHPVALASGPHVAAAFHPEMTGDRRLHRLFLARAGLAAGAAA